MIWLIRIRVKGRLSMIGLGRDSRIKVKDMAQG